MSISLNPFTGQLDLIGSSSGGGGTVYIDTYHVNLFTLSSTDISNKYVTLSGSPTTASKTVLNIIGGIIQDYSVDFTVTGNQLSWNGLGLETLLASGDKLIIQFN